MLVMESPFWSSSDPPWTTWVNATARHGSAAINGTTIDPYDSDDLAGRLSVDSNATTDFNGTASVAEMSAFPAYMTLLMTLACGLILVVGLIGNCLVPVVIWNNRDLRNSTNLFLLNLSLADILVLCVSMPTVLVEIHQRPEVWILGRIMCKPPRFVSFLVSVLLFLSLFIFVRRLTESGPVCVIHCFLLNT